ncbi:MAG: hypothetical protein ACKV0T_29845 [Planctomycetales bacterium]
MANRSAAKGPATQGADVDEIRLVCACSGGELPGFVVSALPKLLAAHVELAETLNHEPLPLAGWVLSGRDAAAPEPHPPRVAAVSLL